MAGVSTRHDRLRRGARHRHDPRRSDRGVGARPRSSASDTERARVLRHRLGEVERRPPRRCAAGRHRPDQDRARARARRDPADRALRSAQPGASTSRRARSTSPPSCSRGSATARRAGPGSARSASAARTPTSCSRRRRPAEPPRRRPRPHSCSRSRPAPRPRSTAPPTRLGDHLDGHPERRPRRRRLHAARRAPSVPAPSVARRRGAGRRTGRRRALLDRRRGSAGRADARRPPVVFMFSGQGSQYPGMARRSLPDRAGRAATPSTTVRDVLEPELGVDLRDAAVPARRHGARRRPTTLRRHRLTQPALFTIEYALRRAVAVVGRRAGRDDRPQHRRVRRRHARRRDVASRTRCGWSRSAAA